jgi:predicted alpha/beta hydrolase
LQSTRPTAYGHTAKVFQAHRDDAPVVLCLPAMGVAADYYESFRRRHRAHGRRHRGAARPARAGTQQRFRSPRRRLRLREILELDLPAAFAALRGAFPGRALYLAGHSLGGQLGLLYAARNPSTLEGLALIAAGTAHYRAWAERQPCQHLAVSVGDPVRRGTLAVVPRYSSGFGGDQPRRLMRDWGRVVQHGRYQPEARNSITRARCARSACRSFR